jgi:hypothetical protein
MATEDREENLRVSGHDWPEELADHSALRSLRRANTVVSVGTVITTSTAPDFAEIENLGQMALQN